MLRWVYMVAGLAMAVPSFAQEEPKDEQTAQEEVKVEVTEETTPEADSPTQEKKEEEPKQEKTPAEGTEKPAEETTEEKKEEPAKTEEKPAEEAEKPAEEKPAEEAQATQEDTETTTEITAEEAPADERAEKPQWNEEATDENKVEVPQPEPAKAEEQKTDAAPQEAPKKDAGLGPDEVMGIDTIDLEDPQGNWLYKRVWWERAESKYEKIRATVNQVLEVRTSFFAKRAELDKNVLDPFYIKIGISQGELQEILSELIARAEKMAQESKAKSLIEKAEADKKALQELQKSVNAVVVKDEEIEKAIMMLVEQIGKIRSIESQAWNDFKSIARVLDDKKARELFYKVDGAWRNIKDLQQYIADQFAGSFDELIERVKEQIAKVDQEVGALKESGVNLKQRLLSMQAPKPAPQEEEEEEEVEPPKGFITRFVIDPVKYIFNSVWSIISWPYHKLFGPKATPEEDDEEEPAEEPVEKKVKSDGPVQETEVTVEEEVQVTEAPEPEMEMSEPDQKPSEEDPEAEDKKPTLEEQQEAEKKSLEEELEGGPEIESEEFQEYDFDIPQEELDEIDMSDLAKSGE